MVNKYTKTMPDIKRLTFLYLSGMTQKEVADELGLTQKIVWRCLRDYKIICRKAAPRNQKQENNNNWKGRYASYSAFHIRVRKLKGKPQYCEVCGTTDKNKKYDWASLNKKYDDPRDYKRMCRSCHWKYDKAHLRLLKGVVKNA